MNAFYDYWREWFAQSPDAKEPYRRIKRPGVNRGNWYPPFSEAPGYGKPDPKEYFHWKLADSDPDGITDEVFWDCYEKARDWLDVRGFESLADSVHAEDCVLRILHYLPTADGLAGEAHRDYDLLTVNVGGTCQGLQIFEPQWYAGTMAWKHREGGIHVGEMLEIYSNPSNGDGNTTIPATSHRIRIPPNTERFAAVFFLLPPKDFVLRPGLTAAQYLKDVMTRAGTHET